MKKIVLFLTLILGLSFANSSFAGNFSNTAVMGGYISCSISSTGSLRCSSSAFNFTVPSGKFIGLASNSYGTICAIDTLGNVKCLGNDQFYLQDNYLLDSTYIDVGNNGYILSINKNKKLSYFGGDFLIKNFDSNLDFVSVASIDSNNACGVLDEGKIICWGSSSLTYNNLFSKNNYTRIFSNNIAGFCALSLDGVVQCSNGSIYNDKIYKELSMGNGYYLLLDNSGSLSCYGGGCSYFSLPTDNLGYLKIFASGTSNYCAIKKDNTIFCSKNNTFNIFNSFIGFNDYQFNSSSFSYQKCENKYFSYEYAWSFFDSNTFSYNSSGSYYQSFNNGYVYKFNDETFLSTYAIGIGGNSYQNDNYLDISGLFSKNLIVKTLGSWSNAIDWQYNQGFKLQSVNGDIEFVSLYGTGDVSYYYIADNNGNRLFPSENGGKGRQFLMNQVNKIKGYGLGDTLYVLLETGRLSKTYTINSISFGDYKTQYSEGQGDQYCVTYTPEDTSHITYDSSTQKYVYDDGDIKGEVKYNPDTNKFDVVDDNGDTQKSIPSTKKQTIEGVDFTQEQVDSFSGQDNINRTNEIKQEETKVAGCSDDGTSLSITWSNFFSQDFGKIVRSFLYCKMDVDSLITYLKINVPPQPDLDFNFVWPKVTFIGGKYFLGLEKVSGKFTVITDKSGILSIDTSPTSGSYLLTFLIFIIYVLFRFTIIFLIFIIYPLFDYISKKISIVLFSGEASVFDPGNLASMFVYIPVLLFRYGVLLSIFAIIVAHLLDVGNYSIDFFNAVLGLFLSSLGTYSFFSNLFNLFISGIIGYSTLYLIYLLVKKFGRVN